MSNIDFNNSITLNGNAGGTAELRKTNNDRDVANFSVATETSYSSKDPVTGEWREKKTTWHNVVAWGPTALYVHNNLKKGSNVRLIGHNVTRKWTKKVTEQGVTIEVDMTSTEIHVDQISIVNPKRRNNTEQPDQEQDFGYDQQEDRAA